MCQALATPVYINEWLHCPKPSAKNSSEKRMISRKKPRSSVLVTNSLSTTPSIIVCTLESLNFNDNFLQLGFIEFRVDRQRKNLARGAFGFRQIIARAQPAFVRGLKMDWHRIVDQCTYSFRLQKRP